MQRCNSKIEKSSNPLPVFAIYVYIYSIDCYKIRGIFPQKMSRNHVMYIRRSCSKSCVVLNSHLFNRKAIKFVLEAD